jgi:hypothetical protein
MSSEQAPPEDLESRSSTKKVCVEVEQKEAQQGRQSQVEWHDEADIYADDDLDLPYPGFVEPSLGCLKQAQPPRSWTLKMVINPWFDRLTM